MYKNLDMNRLLRHQFSPILRRMASSEAEPAKSGMKGPIMGVFGVYGFGLFISSLTQMPLDPERMTIGKSD